MASDPEPKPRSRLENISVAAGIAGSLVTVVLTAWNAQTKNDIDKSQRDLAVQTAAVSAEIQRRDASVEESKERVERYKWVYSLVPMLTEADPTKRNAALAMIRLALSADEAQALLTGLQQSPSAEVRQAATQGFKQIADAELAQLVLQMNSTNTDERKRATGKLEAAYADSPTAITLVLARVQGANLATLSPSGLINTLYYLSRTDPKAWTPENAKVAEEALAALKGQATGAQTKAEVARLEGVLGKVGR